MHIEVMLTLYGSLLSVQGFPGSSVVKNSPAKEKIQETQFQSLGWEDHGEAHGNPLLYSCLENPWTEEPGRL